MTKGSFRKYFKWELRQEHFISVCSISVCSASPTQRWKSLNWLASHLNKFKYSVVQQNLSLVHQM